jgi:hypothetical protein
MMKASTACKTMRSYQSLSNDTRHNSSEDRDSLISPNDHSEDQDYLPKKTVINGVDFKRVQESYVRKRKRYSRSFAKCRLEVGEKQTRQIPEERIVIRR